MRRVTLAFTLALASAAPSLAQDRLSSRDRSFFLYYNNLIQQQNTRQLSQNQQKLQRTVERGRREPIREFNPYERVERPSNSSLSKPSPTGRGARQETRPVPRIYGGERQFFQRNSQFNPTQRD